MVSPARPVWVTTSALVFLGACTLYNSDLLKATEEGAGGTSSTGAAGTGNPCGTGSKCDGGSAGSSSAGGATGGGGATGAGGGTSGAGGSVVATVPYISSTTLSPVISIGLSSEGTLDWAHWGLKTAADYNHKNQPNPLLSTLASIGTKPITLYTMDPTTFAWSDGVPTVSGSSHNGVQVAGEGQGFVVTAPAGVPEVRLLRLYVGVVAGTASIQAKFSDPKASDAVLNDLLSAPSDVWVPQVITVEYQDSAPGTTISVSWKVQNGNDGGTMPAVHLKAVTLSLKSM